MADTYELNPHVRLASYASEQFTYDHRVTESPVVGVPTRVIERSTGNALALLKSKGFLLEPRTEAEVVDYLGENGLDGGGFGHLRALGLLRRYVSQSEALERKVLDSFDRRYSIKGSKALSPFDDDADAVTFAPKTFFNLPTNVKAEPCHVGLLGFPQSSTKTSLGTETAPGNLRLLTRSWCWFEISERGMYSEIRLDDKRPGLLGWGVVARDCGDFECAEQTIDEMVESLRARLTAEFFDQDVFPLIVGGDHAITYPIVRTYLERQPELGLLHLDAHNDCFYVSDVAYNHAAPISNLIRRTEIQRIVSFGLRTFADRRVHHVDSIYEMSASSDRLRQHSLSTTKRMLMNPVELTQEFTLLNDRPYYLTIDLDVLSDSAIGGQLSTPFGTGIEWHELFLFVELAFMQLNIVGCDIVEYNSTSGSSSSGDRFLLSSLLLLVADGLARNNPKFAAQQTQASRRGE